MQPHRQLAPLQHPRHLLTISLVKRRQKLSGKGIGARTRVNPHFARRALYHKTRTLEDQNRLWLCQLARHYPLRQRRSPRRIQRQRQAVVNRSHHLCHRKRPEGQMLRNPIRMIFIKPGQRGKDHPRPDHKSKPTMQGANGAMNDHASPCQKAKSPATPKQLDPVDNFSYPRAVGILPDAGAPGRCVP